MQELDLPFGNDGIHVGTRGSHGATSRLQSALEHKVAKRLGIIRQKCNLKDEIGACYTSKERKKDLETQIDELTEEQRKLSAGIRRLQTMIDRQKQFGDVGKTNS